MSMKKSWKLVVYIVTYMSTYFTVILILNALGIKVQTVPVTCASSFFGVELLGLVKLKLSKTTKGGGINAPEDTNNEV